MDWIRRTYARWQDGAAFYALALFALGCTALVCMLPGYVLAEIVGSDHRMLWGAFSAVILAPWVISDAIASFADLMKPIIERQTQERRAHWRREFPPSQGD